MSPIAAFVLGVVVGWVIEWIIDWVYWRRKGAETRRRLDLAESRLAQAELDLKNSRGNMPVLENQLSSVNAENAALKEKLAALEAEKAKWQPAAFVSSTAVTNVPPVEAPSSSFANDRSNMPSTPTERPVEMPPELQVPTEGSVSSAATDLPKVEPSGSSYASDRSNMPSIPAGRTDAVTPEPQVPPAAPPVPDDLIIIKGIGPVIARKLNESGIYTFKQLAAITPERLRQIVGDVIQRLADEQDIIDQAKVLADRQDQAPKF